jgi:protein SCO1/2
MSLKVKLLFVSVAAVALSAGFLMSSLQQESIEKDANSAKQKALAAARKSYSPIQGSILTPARKIAVPALKKNNGQAFTNQDLLDQWSMIFFGYTNCPDVCPTTMGVLAQAKKTALKNNHIFPQVIFVSVDPQRDKLEMLTDYLQYFDKDFIGVTGDEKLINALTLQMSVAYMKMETEEGSEGYIVDHSAAVLLLNTKGKLVAFLNPPHNPKSILKDFQTVVNLGN